ncbi:MAG: hypothetical protein KDK08_16870, partial [Rhizobiaceae bacterium]|nr:hypothetical protein [Rhizobiaceae bacterium]
SAIPPKKEARGGTVVSEAMAGSPNLSLGVCHRCVNPMVWAASCCLAEGVSLKFAVAAGTCPPPATREGKHVLQN